MNTETAIDQYSFWRRRLAGENVPIHDGEVHAGFYRLKERNGAADQPVAYWFAKDGALRCRIGSKDVDEQIARERWVWAQKLPISHELYKAVMEGAHWPDQHEAVTLSNRAPDDDSIESMRDQIDALAGEVKKLLEKGAAKSQEEADRAGDLADRLGKLYSKADKAREAEKAPHWKLCTEIEDKWRPIKATAEVYKNIKAIVIAPFLRAEQAKKDAAEREAREAAEKLRREAEERAAEAQRAADAAMQEGGEMSPDLLAAAAEAESAKKAADDAEAQANSIADRKVTAGTRGRATHLRTATKVIITNRSEAYAHFKDRTDFIAAINAVIQQFAEAEVKAGNIPAGITVEKEKNAA